MASDREQFCLAVRTIYESDSKEERARAEQWLEAWQRQASAWETAASVLDEASGTDDERFMAAQTLRTKTQRDFEELSPQQASGLQNTLVKLLIRYGEGLKPVRTQLCVAIASLAVHLPASSFGEAGVIGWLYMKLNAETNPSAAVVCLLELLITLPQEVRSNRVAVRPERRRQAEQEMKGFFEPALQALHGAWSHSGERVLETVLRALAQWLNLTSASGISCDTLRQNELVRKAFQGLGDPQLFDSAVDCLDELIWCTVSLEEPVPRIRGEMMPLIQELVSCIMSLRPRFHVALRRAINDSNDRETDEGLSDEAKAMDHDDDDTVRCMVRLFLDITDAYQILVAQGSAETITPLEGVLEICSHPDWDTFSMALGTIGKIAARVTDNPPMPECMERIKNIYFSFVTVLGKRVRFSDNFAQQTSETRRQFKHIRYEIEDVLKDIVAVLGPDALLEVLARQLSDALSGGADGIKDWKDAEAAYFCMKALADQPPQHCNPRLLQVLRSVNSCADNEMIQFTACTLIHKFSCWLANSAIEDPSLLDLVPELFRHTIHSLGRHMSAGGASLAFAALCRDCTPTVGEKCSQDMLNTFERAASTESANWVREGPAGAAVMPLEEEDICSIVEGTATVLAHAASQGSSEAEQSLGKCIELLLRPLAALVQAYQPQGGFPTDDRRVAATATDGMHRVAMFAQHLTSCPSFIGGHLPHLWDFIVNFTSLASQQEAIVESSLKVIIKSIGAAQGHASEQWLPGILNTVPQAYTSTHFSAYLYLASHVVRACGTEASPHRLMVAQAVTPMIQEACGRLASLNACNQSPHDADDLFLMAYKGLSHAPSLFLDRDLLEGLLRVAAVGLLVQHQDAFRSIQSFLFRLLDVQTLSCAPDQRATQVMLQELLMTYGPPLVRLELGAAVGLASENRIPDMAGTFLQLLLATAQAGQQWLQGAVTLLPDIAATTDDKQLFVQRVSQACAKTAANSHHLDEAIWDVQEALSELSRTCRRNPNVRRQSERALAPQELWPDLGLDGR